MRFFCACGIESWRGDRRRKSHLRSLQRFSAFLRGVPGCPCVREKCRSMQPSNAPASRRFQSGEMSRSSERIGAVILAAGGSSRFGQPKQLIPFRGRTLVRRIIDAACEADCSPVVVVTGSEDEKLHSELDHANVVAVQNQKWQRGIGSSIRCGIEAFTNSSPDIAASVLLVCDQPAVDARVIQSLIALRETTGKVSSHRAMPIRSVFPPSSPVPFLKSCFYSMIRQARNRLFCEVGSALRRSHSPKARSTSIVGKIGKSSTVAR